MIEVAAVVGPAALAVIVPAVDPVARLLNGVPEVARWGAVCMPSFLLAASVSIVCSVSRSRSTGLAGKTTEGYHFSCAARRAAKLVTIPLLALLAFRLTQTLPVRIIGELRTVGYLCRSSGEALNEGSLVLEDAFSGTVSSIATLDDTGYFVADAHPWAAPPKHLRIVEGSCRGTSASIEPDDDGRVGCDSANPGVEGRRPAGLWVIQCKEP
jgi:hypothetical protein